MALRQGVSLLALAFGLLLGLDSLIFRIGPYTRFLEPESSSGQVELVLARERQAQSQSGDNLVATLGDSRLSYYPREATTRGYFLRQAGLAGSSPRAWYYILRDLDPTASRYRAVVLAVNDFDDEDMSFCEADDLRSVHFTAARLGFADVAEMVSSYPSWRARWEALLGTVLKGYAYQADVRAFLDHPRKRLADIRAARQGFPQWTGDFVESDETLEGLEIDWSTYVVTYPPGATPNQRQTIDSFLARRPVAQSGMTAAFRRRWLGKIVDRYRGSRTKVIFIRLPRGAMVRPDGLVQKLSSSVRDLASRPNVLLADEHAFDSLEQRALFKDGLHLNHLGNLRFSRLLADEVARLLGPP